MIDKTNTFEYYYKALLNDILTHGTAEENRTGVDAITLFGQQLKIDMSNSLLPIVTGKQIFYNKAYHEFVWFIEGMTTINYLNQHNIYWWDQYANYKGELGKTYGYQLRSYNGEFDQLDYVCRELKQKSRRAHITLWNPTELNETALPCCYTGFTFVVTGNGTKLNMNMQFRSSDAFLGLPYDIIVGALLMKRVCDFSELEMGEFCLSLDNVHIYSNHIDQVNQYLDLPIFDLPVFTGTDNIAYKHGPFIGAKLNN
jgi:thymidylate synthase